MDRHQGHAFAGIHGAKPMYTQLCEPGYEDVSIAALKQPSFPSYAYTLGKGFTTWPEVPLQYEADQPMPRHSLNHPMQVGSNVPVTKGGAVTEGAESAAARRRLKFVAAQEGREIYEIGSGSYAFQADLAQPPAR